MGILIELEKALTKIEEFFARVTGIGDRVDKVEKDIQSLVSHNIKQETRFAILENNQQGFIDHDKKLYSELEKLRERVESLATYISSQDNVIKSHEILIKRLQDAQQDNSVGNYSNEAQTNKGWEILMVEHIDTWKQYTFDGHIFNNENDKNGYHADDVYGNRNFKITAIRNRFTKEVWYSQGHCLIAGIAAHIKYISSGKDGRIIINFMTHFEQ